MVQEAIEQRHEVYLSTLRHTLNSNLAINRFMRIHGDAYMKVLDPVSDEVVDTIPTSFLSELVKRVGFSAYMELKREGFGMKAGLTMLEEGIPQIVEVNKLKQIDRNLDTLFSAKK